MPSPVLQRPPRVALIGVTGYGTIYLNLVREALLNRSIELTAAVIINADEVPAIAAELSGQGATIYPDADDFFQKEAGRVELCLIPVGIQWHARLTIAALRAGMNVLVEKPLAGSVEDVLAIRAAEAATGRWVAVGFQDLYAAEARWLKAQILGGAIGRLEEVRMLGLWPRPKSYFTRNHWAGRAAADGAAVMDSPLNNAFAHFVNLALFFAGNAPEVSSDAVVETAELYRAHKIEMFDTAIVRAVSESGSRFWFGVSHAISVTREPEICLLGSAGRAEWWHEQRCIVTDADGRRKVTALPTSEHSRKRMFNAVLARLKDPSAFVCTTAMAELHTRLVEAVNEAAPVLEFSEDRIHWTRSENPGGEIPVVRDLADSLGRAFTNGSTLASSSPFPSAILVSP